MMKDTVENFYNPLFGYINKRINNALDAEDLLQDVFFKLSQSDLDKIVNLKSWVYAITKNAIIDYYRKKKLELNALEEQFAEETAVTDSTIYELSQCIRPFIEQLPEDYALLLRLHELEGVSQKDIAQQLDMNYVTVRSKIQRGRLKLKDLFANCCNIERGGRGSIICYSNNSKCC
ncbi:RNA polymerase sigma factor SigZ [Winogradskyella sp.]|uniref:RNA polymerase sigma factor SigZ n=1 Tax=Winogradskyella sp. TaxID=1883156 RepID=UPI003BAA32AD